MMQISPETQLFIREHSSDDVRALALQAKKYPDIDMPTAITQIAGRSCADCRMETVFKTEAATATRQRLARFQLGILPAVLKTVSIRQSAQLLPAMPRKAKFSPAFCETVAAMFPPVQSESNRSAPILLKPSRLILNTIHTENGCPFCRSGENHCVPNTCSTGAVVFQLRFVSLQPMHKVHSTELVHRALLLPAILQSAAKTTCRKADAK